VLQNPLLSAGLNLIAQRTLFRLEANYIGTLEHVWINAATLQGLLLTDGLGLPAAPGERLSPNA